MPSDQYDGFCFRKDMIKKDPTGQKYKGKWESKCTGTCAAYDYMCFFFFLLLLRHLVILWQGGQTEQPLV